MHAHMLKVRLCAYCYFSLEPARRNRARTRWAQATSVTEYCQCPNSIHTKGMLQCPETPNRHPSWDATFWRAPHKTGMRPGAGLTVKLGPVASVNTDRTDRVPKGTAPRAY
eukprot:13104243-Alexandrium_andersonii.AAC.1